MRTFDFLIIGAGFGGSLLAAILAKSGRSVILADRSVHPRFAIGESTTPLADATLLRLALRYNLPSLLPLTQYGLWKRTLPELMCGRKRGFTYFRQQPFEDLNPDNFAHRRLLAAASVDNEHSDTQWLRSDVDQYFFQQAEAQGVHCLEGCQYLLEPLSDGWKFEELDSLRSEPSGQKISARAEFVVDATGAGGGLVKLLNIPSQTHILKTSSRSVFAHFQGARSCESLLKESGIETSAFPFACDDAAVHQVMDDGWMWQLRFDDDTLSAGFVIDQRTTTENGLPGQFQDGRDYAQAEWAARLQRYPFLHRQFEGAQIIRANGGLQYAARLQRLTTQAADARWALLPNTAGFIDALHSTGIAHTLSGVERLAEILLNSDAEGARTSRLHGYSREVIREIQLIDELVEGCYAALPEFDLWCDWAMLYFAAATSMEKSMGQMHSAGPVNGESGPGFLRTNDRAFREMLSAAREQLQTAVGGSARRKAGQSGDVEQLQEESLSPQSQKNGQFREWLRQAIRPWNNVGLLDAGCDGFYFSTAAPPKTIPAVSEAGVAMEP